MAARQGIRVQVIGADVEQECRLGTLKRVLPKRRKVNGTRSGITGEHPLSRTQGARISGRSRTWGAMA